VKSSGHCSCTRICPYILILRLKCCGLAPTSNKEPRGHSLTPPFSWWDRKDNQKEKAKFVVWHKNSLTERQRERKITAIILIKRIYRVQFSHYPMLSLLLRSKSPRFSQLAHLNTEHDITWY